MSRSTALLGIFACSAGCSPCGEDAYPLPLDGAYTHESTSSGYGVPSAHLDVGRDIVVLQYSRADGSVFRATYRVRVKEVK